MKFGLIALMLVLSSNVFATTKLVLDQALPFYDIIVSSFEAGKEDPKEICQNELIKIVQNLSDEKVAIVQVENCEQKAAAAAILIGLDLYVGRVVLSHNEIIPTREEVEAVLKQYDAIRIKE